jgi:DNA-binding GntR family transcriptional regulator
MELGSLRLALANGANPARVDAAIGEPEALPDDAHWRELTEVHGRIHHEIVTAAGNDHLLNSYARCGEEMRVLLTALQPDFSTRRLLDQLHIGDDVAFQALADDLELAGRAALFPAPHPAEASARAIGARPTTS